MRLRLATLTLWITASVRAALVDPVDLALAGSPEAVRLRGARAGDQTGYAVAGAGDWNGDGLSDFLIGSPFAASPDATASPGIVQVVLGRSAPPAVIDLAAPGSVGTVIIGEADGDQCGRSVAGIGDWNGDGRDDIAIGAPFSEAGHGTETGRVYVLFGRSPAPPSIHLAALGPTEGVVITGAARADQTGFAVAAAGDWNADGRPDLAIGAPNADFAATDAGRVFVLFGRVSPSPAIDLAVPQAGLTVIDGADDSNTVPVINLFGDSAGFALAGGADLTGDGIDDLIVNAPAADAPARPNAGMTYVLPGSASPEPLIALASPPSGVRRIEGASTGDQAFVIVSGTFNPFFGGAVALPGDLDGDGQSDLAVASQFADVAGDSSGLVHVVRGGLGLPSVLPLSTPRPEDISIWGEAAQDLLGRGITGAGDFNGDGAPDLAIGAPQANALGRPDAGSVTVLFGSPRWPPVFPLPDFGEFGLRLAGGSSGDLAGLAVAGIGDWNGDGSDDLAVSSPGASGGIGRAGAGVVTVLLGVDHPIDLTATETWVIYR